MHLHAKGSNKHLGSHSISENKPERFGHSPKHIKLSIPQPQEEHDLATRWLIIHLFHIRGFMSFVKATQLQWLLWSRNTYSRDI